MREIGIGITIEDLCMGKLFLKLNKKKIKFMSVSRASCLGVVVH